VGGTARLFVISGPSGVGKGTLVSLVRQIRPDLGLTVSATTRPPRPGEVSDVSYHFLSEEEFSRRVSAGEFLEWAEVHGHRYGTLKDDVDAMLASGRSVVLEIDVQGALKVRKVLPTAVLVFIEPPSLGELERRLRGRGTESEAQIDLRLANARRELELSARYDVRLVNDDRDAAAHRLGEGMEGFGTGGGEPHIF